MHGSTARRSGSYVFRGTLVALGILLAIPAVAAISKGDLTIRLEPVASGLTSPVLVTHAGDGSGRLFIVEQSGPIRIVKNGALLATPFLDLTSEIPPLSPGFDERGVLGMAFHPDYETNGRFFVRYSKARAGDPSEPCFGTSRGCHEEILAEFQVSADPDVALPAPTILFRIDEPQFNHDSGGVEFGPDGYLYFTLGDGGGAHDGLADVPPSHGPNGNGQNIETALGSILRIDVDAGAPYGIPADNPFVGGPGLDEIYAYGLRNPFRFSFDDGPGGDGRLFLGDVGQNLFEEVNLIVKGGNYGWVIREGLSCFDPFQPTNPPAACASTGALGEPLLDPIVDYSHAEGGISVIGGYVYRGTRSPSLAGTYVFGDFAMQFSSPSGRLYYLVEPSAGQFEIREFRIGANDAPYGRFLKGFGEGEDGEIYVLGSRALAPTGVSGVVERLVVEPVAAVDVKPGSCPNPLNVGSNGKLPVAILGTDSFDVEDVDLSTVALVRDDGVVALTALLDGQQANAGAGTGSPATGQAWMTLDLATNEFTMDLEFEGLLGTQTNQHVHAPATPDQNSGVLFGIPGPGPFEGFRIVLSDAEKQVILDGLAYINIHSSVNPGGEIRGQIVPAGVPPVEAQLTDVGTPFDGDQCGCHESDPDGRLDLVLHFNQPQVVSMLGLDLADGGELVPLAVTGGLLPGGDADTTVFQFGMDAFQQVPANQSPGTGSCTVTLEHATGAVSVSCTYEGLEGNAVNSHIHGLAPPGTNAGVMIPLTMSGGTSGTITGGGILTAAQMDGMLAGLTYVNLHTDVRPPGEIRGQVAGGGSFRASDCVLIVPPFPCDRLPGRVSELRLVPDGGDGTLLLDWGTATDASGYLLFTDDRANGAFSTVAGASTAPHYVASLEPAGGMTFFHVAGFGPCGVGPR